MITKEALKIFDITVAMATPATPSLKQITSTRFKTTFTIPDKIRYYIGLLVSPKLLNAADPKL